MKIKYFVRMIFFLILLLISSIIISNWNKHIIYLIDGQIIEAEKSWIIFDEVFYEKGKGTLYTVKTDAVNEILISNFSSFHDWKIILIHAIDSKQGVFGVLMDKTARYIGLIIFCVFCLSGFIRFILSQRSQLADKDDEDEPITIPISSQASDFEKIVLFFLNMYLQHLKAKKKDRYHYRKTAIAGLLNTTVYDFRVNIDGQWQTRRISVGRIGEESGARSKCFYVIYDDHFVVKIPPEPVTDFNVYIQSIQAEWQIADLLSPRECLVPRLSIVLKQIPFFVNCIGNNAISNEQKCIHEINEYPEYQKFLKIGESFAYFMDLSKYFFLGQILKDCHDSKNEILKEIVKHQDLIWTSQTFSDRYGEDSAGLYYKLQDIYELFNQRFQNSAIPSFQKKIWFTGIFLDGSNSDILRDIPDNALAILNTLKEEQYKILNEYKITLENYTQVKFFKQNIVKIQCICARLVELLAWLFFKNIAIRDLKPDNLLVAGDPSKYPHFLNSTDGFEIGLIDVEIAISLEPENEKSENREIKQPKLGWTPFYATPSHMFVNKVLEQLYDDVTYIFFLQDWYATLAMIYQSITGEKMFIKTAATLVTISKELKRYYGDPSKMIIFAKKANEKFWKDAAGEFASKMNEKETLLKSVHLEICRPARKMFKKAAAKSRQEALQTQLLEIKSDITAYDLLKCLFAKIEEIMNRH